MYRVSKQRLEIPYSDISVKNKVSFHLQYNAEKTKWLTCLAVLLLTLQVQELGFVFLIDPKLQKLWKYIFKSLDAFNPQLNYKHQRSLG